MYIKNGYHAVQVLSLILEP